MAEIDRVRATGMRFGCVPADAGYGLSAPFRQALTERGLKWAVGMSMQRAILQMLATKAARGHDRSTELLIKLAGQGAKEGDAAMGRDLGADDLTLLTMYIADVAAGNKAVDGSFPDEPMEYKEPPA